MNGWTSCKRSAAASADSSGNNPMRCIGVLSNGRRSGIGENMNIEMETEEFKLILQFVASLLTGKFKADSE